MPKSANYLAMVQSKIIRTCLKRFGPIEGQGKVTSKTLIAPSNLYARFLLAWHHGLHTDFDKIQILVNLVCSLLLLHLWLFFQKNVIDLTCPKFHVSVYHNCLSLQILCFCSWFFLQMAENQGTHDMVRLWHSNCKVIKEKKYLIKKCLAHWIQQTETGNCGFEFSQFLGRFSTSFTNLFSS